MTQLDLLAPCKVPERGTQNFELLMAMKNQGKRLTVAKALSEHGCYALSQRIGELKRMGWPIRDRFIRTVGGATIKEYWIE
jgi:hypothetical protein